MCFLSFSTTFVWNIFHSKKTWARCDQKCYDHDDDDDNNNNNNNSEVDIPVVRLNYVVRWIQSKKHNYKIWLNDGVY